MTIKHIKQKTKFSYLAIILLCFLSLFFNSCNQFTNDDLNSNEENHNGQIITPQKDYFTLVVTPQFGESYQNNIRSAYPIFDNSTIGSFDYWISSSEFVETKGTYANGTIIFNIVSGTFTATQITVSAKLGSSVLFSASTTISYTIEDTKEISLFFEPYTSSSVKGNINLEISIPTGYSITCDVIDEEEQLKSSYDAPGTTYPICVNNSTTNCRILTDENIGIEPGTYKARIKVYKNSDLRSFILQTIEVWPGLTTNLWYLPDGTTSQTYQVPAETKRTFYVRGDGGTLYSNSESLGISLENVSVATTSNDGSILSPFNSLQRALRKCTDSTADYTIYIDGEVIDGVIIGGSDPDIGANIAANSITIKGITGPDKDIINRNLNTATNNGSVFVIDKSVTLKIIGLGIKGGYSNGDGGGLYISDSGATVSLVDCKIEKNKANNGAGIYNNGTCYIYGSTVIGKSDANTPATNYTTNTSNSATVKGGGIYNTSNLYLGYSVYNSAADNTKTEWTGGICANYSSQEGGGIYNTGIVQFVSGTISYNSSGYYGGGGLCSADSSAYVTMSGSAKINNNKANENGGGVRITGGTLDVTGSAGITYNQAGGGAGLYIATSTVNLKDNSVIDHNTSGGWGGGIFIQNNGASLTISGNAAITNNRGTEGGGIDSVTDDATAVLTIEMSGGTISGNNGTSDGGGVRLSGGSFVMSAGEISGNTSGSGKGGGVRVKETSTFQISGSAYIPAGETYTNDVYLENGIKIQISDNLTPPTGEKTAYIIPYTYLSGRDILSGTNEIVEANYDKFGLVQNAEDINSVWEITLYGKLKKLISLLIKDDIPDGYFDGTINISEVFKSNRPLGKIKGIIASDHETTQGEYETYCIYGGTEPSDAIGKGSDFPVYNVSWFDAIVYCNLRSINDHLDPVYIVDGKTDPAQWTGIQGSENGRYCAPNPCTWDVTILGNKNGWRLPTEVEWEYLARGGKLNNDNPVYIYSGSNDPDTVAWYGPTDGSGGTSGNMAHPVKQLAPNDFGLYDMSGNVWEWTNDWHTYNTSNTGPWVFTDTPSSGAPKDGSNNCRVTKGGGWLYGISQSPVSNRASSDPSAARYSDLGFRVVRGAQYVGSKLPSETKEVGDIVFNDGSFESYVDGMTITDEQKLAAIAIIFYKGTDLNNMQDNGHEDTTTVRTLGVGLIHDSSGTSWCENGIDADDTEITTIICSATKIDGELWTFTGDKNGSDNFEQVQAFTANSSPNYIRLFPAFFWCSTYNTRIIYSESSSRIISGSEFEKGWYLPSIAELYYIYTNGKGSGKVFDIDTLSHSLGGNKFNTYGYMSSSQSNYPDSQDRIYVFNFGTCDCYNNEKNYNPAFELCAIREF